MQQHSFTDRGIVDWYSQVRVAVAPDMIDVLWRGYGEVAGMLAGPCGAALLGILQ
jgi:hypothetical protein